MESRQTSSSSVSRMYVDTDEERGLPEKIEWMKSSYHSRMGSPAKILFITHEDAEAFEENKGELIELLGLAVIRTGPPLIRPGHFILSQHYKDIFLKGYVEDETELRQES